MLHKKHTLTGRFTPRPHSCSLTGAYAASKQVVAFITTIGGCLSKACPISVTNLAVLWISKNSTNCKEKDYIMHFGPSSRCIPLQKYIPELSLKFYLIELVCTMHEDNSQTYTSYQFHCASFKKKKSQTLLELITHSSPETEP